MLAILSNSAFRIIVIEHYSDVFAPIVRGVWTPFELKSERFSLLPIVLLNCILNMLET